ncbi:MAG: hypothetical protein P8K72_02380 [Flavobacteriaceae bacterium]|nr:hypothetical protein [Flavobacteriaceae bacterium]
MEKLLRILKSSLFLLVLIMLWLNQLKAQEKETEFTLGGYINYLPSYLEFERSNEIDFQKNQLIHNRLNIRGYIKDNFSIGLELRNRILFNEGEFNDDNGYFDLSHYYINNSKFKIHSMIDRMWLKYQKEKIEISIGRQRVNWGINTIWNSNDLFNAYNFIDFDYIERPGSDVVRFQYSGDNLSSIDVVYKPSTIEESSVIAALYKINKMGYDFQFLLADYYNDIALGGGWAGNIKNAGFKGEITYFIPDESSENNSTSLSTSIDYSFTNGLYILGSHLYNSNGYSDPQQFELGAITQDVLSPKNLMPSKNSYLIQASAFITPAINTSFTFLYGQGINFFFFSPNITYDISSSLDASIIGQFFYMDDEFNPIIPHTGTDFAPINTISRINGYYARLKWSF